MNKYQEALDCVFNTIYGHKAFYKELKQFREKHKQYPEDALQELVDIETEYRELKDKATPMRPKNYYTTLYKEVDQKTYFACPICMFSPVGCMNDDVGRLEQSDSYCANCGQALDWSEEDEK